LRHAAVPDAPNPQSTPCGVPHYVQPFPCSPIESWRQTDVFPSVVLLFEGSRKRPTSGQHTFPKPLPKKRKPNKEVNFFERVFPPFRLLFFFIQCTTMSLSVDQISRSWFSFFLSCDLFLSFLPSPGRVPPHRETEIGGVVSSLLLSFDFFRLIRFYIVSG